MGIMDVSTEELIEWTIAGLRSSRCFPEELLDFVVETARTCQRECEIIRNGKDLSAIDALEEKYKSFLCDEINTLPFKNMEHPDLPSEFIRLSNLNYVIHITK